MIDYFQKELPFCLNAIGINPTEKDAEKFIKSIEHQEYENYIAYLAYVNIDDEVF